MWAATYMSASIFDVHRYVSKSFSSRIVIFSLRLSSLRFQSQLFHFGKISFLYATYVFRRNTLLFTYYLEFLLFCRTAFYLTYILVKNRISMFAVCDRTVLVVSLQKWANRANEREREYFSRLLKIILVKTKKKKQNWGKKKHAKRNREEENANIPFNDDLLKIVYL